MEIDSLETEVAIAGDGAASIAIHNLCRALEAARDKLPPDTPEHAVANFQIRMIHARFPALAWSAPFHDRDQIEAVELSDESAKGDEIAAEQGGAS